MRLIVGNHDKNLENVFLNSHHTHTHKHTQIHTLMHKLTQTQIHTLMHKLTQTQTHTLTHKLTHTHTHTHTTYTHTNTHTVAGKKSDQKICLPLLETHTHAPTHKLPHTPEKKQELQPKKQRCQKMIKMCLKNVVIDKKTFMLPSALQSIIICKTIINKTTNIAFLLIFVILEKKLF
jgi:hypothetical protein